MMGAAPRSLRRGPVSCSPSLTPRPVRRSSWRPSRWRRTSRPRRPAGSELASLTGPFELERTSRSTGPSRRDRTLRRKMNVAELLRDPPRLHRDESGEVTSWRLADDVLDFLDQTVTSDSRTLETGEGVSTILFALKGASHLCVSPNEYSVQRIKEFCATHRISTDRLQFTMTPSDVALPRLNGLELDLELIDGGHGFPIPFLDWHYTAQLLKVGGYLIVDDTQLWTGQVLKDFPPTQPEGGGHLAL